MKSRVFVYMLTNIKKYAMLKLLFNIRDICRKLRYILCVLFHNDL